MNIAELIKNFFMTASRSRVPKTLFSSPGVHAWENEGRTY